MEKKAKKAAGFKMVPGTEEKCIWMEAGVIDYKLCNNYYNCHTCAFDKAMKEPSDRNAEARRLGLDPDGKKSHIVEWRAKMKQKQGLERKCRHTLTGRAPVRLCPYTTSAVARFRPDARRRTGVAASVPDFRHSRERRIQDTRRPFLPLRPFLGEGGKRRPHPDRPGHFSTRVFGKADKFDQPLTGEEIKFSEIGLLSSVGEMRPTCFSAGGGDCRRRQLPGRKRTRAGQGSPYNDGWLMVVEPSK